MTPEEAKERVAADKEKLRALETEVARLASTQATPVLLAVFVLHNKLKFYGAVIRILREKGIS